MPPAVSDNESDIDIPDQIPAKALKVETEDDVNDDDELDDEEYIVEEVLSHKKQRNKILYEIKWLGYDDETDRTWEPIENLDNAQEALDKYHQKIGEVPGGAPVSSKKGKGKRGSETLESPAPSKKSKGGRKGDANGDIVDFEPPVGSWENAVTRIEAILEEDDDLPPGTKPKKDGKMLLGLLAWDNGKRTQHKMSILRIKCPQRLLDYYENHL